MGTERNALEKRFMGILVFYSLTWSWDVIILSEKEGIKAPEATGVSNANLESKFEMRLVLPTEVPSAVPLAVMPVLA